MGGYLYKMPKWLSRNWDKMSAKDIKVMQNKKLRHFIRSYVYPYSPFYHNLMTRLRISPDDIKTTEDLQKLPFTTKDDIAPSEENIGRPREFILQPDEKKIREFAPRKDLARIVTRRIFKGNKKLTDLMEWEFRSVHVHFTTGRTAQPTPFFYSLRDLENIKEAGRRMVELGNVAKAIIIVNAFPYAPHLAFWHVFMGNMAVGSTAVHTGGGKVLGTETIIRLIESTRAEAIIALPGYLYHLLREALREGRDFSQVKYIITGAERLSESLRNKIREMLQDLGAKSDVRIGASYGFTEGRVAWGECDREWGTPSPGYHTYPDMEFFEIINPKTGERVAEGEEGEIVYTALDWRGSCVLRYRTGDIVLNGIEYSPCPVCGRTVPRITYDIKRSAEVIELNLTKVKGTLIDLNTFFPLLMGHHDILEWQIELKKRNDDPFDLDELWLYISPREGVDVVELEEYIKATIKNKMEISPTKVVFLELKDLLSRLGMETSLKEMRILDKRPQVD